MTARVEVSGSAVSAPAAAPSNEREFICKHCGGSRFSAEVTARGTSAGSVRVHNGQPHFKRDWENDYFDYEEDSYSCDDCGAYEGEFENLVTEKLAEGQLLRPCGRCDHSVTDHPLPDFRADVPKHYTRPSMPCTAEGCDCHDYYDLAIANAGVTLEIAA